MYVKFLCVIFSDFHYCSPWYLSVVFSLNSLDIVKSSRKQKNVTFDISVLFRSYSMIDESSGQHLKDIENTLEV